MTQSTLFTVAVAAVVSVTSIGVYDRLFAQPPRAMATADVARVFADQQAAFAKQVTDATDDAQRDKAVLAAKDFAARLEKALATLTHDCRCLVISRSSILGPTPDMPDLTDQLQAMVKRHE